MCYGETIHDFDKNPFFLKEEIDVPARCHKKNGCLLKVLSISRVVNRVEQSHTDIYIFKGMRGRNP